MKILLVFLLASLSSATAASVISNLDLTKTEIKKSFDSEVMKEDEASLVMSDSDEALSYLYKFSFKENRLSKIVIHIQVKQLSDDWQKNLLSELDVKFGERFEADNGNSVWFDSSNDTIATFNMLDIEKGTALLSIVRAK